MIRQAMAVRKTLRMMQDERRAAEWQRDREIAAEADEGGMIASPDAADTGQDMVERGMAGPEQAIAPPQPAARPGESRIVGQHPVIRFFETDMGQNRMGGTVRRALPGLTERGNGGSGRFAASSRDAA